MGGIDALGVCYSVSAGDFPFIMIAEGCLCHLFAASAGGKRERIREESRWIAAEGRLILKRNVGPRFGTEPEDVAIGIGKLHFIRPGVIARLL